MKFIIFNFYTISSLTFYTNDSSNNPERHYSKDDRRLAQQATAIFFNDNIKVW